MSIPRAPLPPPPSASTTAGGGEREPSRGTGRTRRAALTPLFRFRLKRTEDRLSGAEMRRYRCTTSRVGVALKQTETEACPPLLSDWFTGCSDE